MLTWQMSHIPPSYLHHHAAQQRSYAPPINRERERERDSHFRPAAPKSAKQIELE